MENIKKYLNNNDKNGDDYYSDDSDYEEVDKMKILDKSNLIYRDVVVMVSSMDRDWVNRTDETPFNFSVKLGGAGKIDGYLTTRYTPRNIVSIGIDRMILDNRNMGLSYSNSFVNMTKIPYLIVNVDGINDVVSGTNSKIDNAIGFMTPAIPLPSAYASSNFIEFKNIIGKGKEFLNYPVASIGKMDISIKTQLGGTPNILYDVLDIENITYDRTDESNVATEYLVIQTSMWFHPRNYGEGDIIKIQNYEYRDTGVYDEATDFNNFINRDEGHKIITTATSDNSKLLKNRIYVMTPSQINQTTGNISVDEWFSQLQIKSMGNITTASLVSDDGGKLINTNLQSHLIFKFRIVDKEYKFMRDII